jgi:hypothetical protein
MLPTVPERVNGFSFHQLSQTAIHDQGDVFYSTLAFLASFNGHVAQLGTNPAPS